MEAGAGRFSSNHKLLIKPLKNLIYKKKCFFKFKIQRYDYQKMGKEFCKTFTRSNIRLLISGY